MNTFPKSIEVTEQLIDLSQLTESEKLYFLNLRAKLIELYKRANKSRVAISLSGVSGAGKSVTRVILGKLMKDAEIEFSFYSCGLDGFHFDNTALEEKGLKEVKGRFDTYDTEKLKEKLQSFSMGKEISFPIYSRNIHNPIDAGINIDKEKALLLMEGLWFLRDDMVWKDIRSHFAYNFNIVVSDNIAKKNVVGRHVRGGRTLEAAEVFYEQSDNLNSVEILNNSVEADETLEYYKNTAQ